MEKMKNWALKLFIVNGIINYRELHVLQQLNQKLTRKSPQVFTYVFLIASHRTFTRKSLQVSIIFCSKVIESSREDHEKLSLFIFCSKLLKVYDKVTASFHYSFLTARFLKVHEKVTTSCQYLLLLVVTNYWKFTT